MLLDPRIRPTLHADEPALSWFRRWGEMLGYLNLRSACQSAGIDLFDLDQGRANAQIARVFELPEGTFDDSTIIVADDGTCSLRGYTMPLSEMARRRVRYCKDCLLEDEKSKGRRGEPLARLRASWRLRSINACPVHRRLLSVADTDHRLFVSTLIDLSRDLGLSAASEPDDPEPRVGFETYLLGRMGFGPQHSSAILDEVEPGDLPTLVRGAGLALWERSPEGVREANQLHNDGFETLGSLERFTELLEVLDRRLQSQPRYKDLKTYRMYVGLAQMFGPQPYGDRYLSLRTHAAEFIAARYPTGGNRHMYGVSTPRRLYTLEDLYRRRGSAQMKARKIFAKIGVSLEGGGNRYISAENVAKYEAIIDRIIGMDELRQVLGVSTHVARELVAAGIIVPWSGGSSSELHKFLFDRDVVEGLLSQLIGHVEWKVKTGKPPHGLLTLRRASAKPGLSHPGLVKAMVDGRIRCEALMSDSRHGLGAVLLRARDLVALAGPRFESMATTSQVTLELSVSFATASLLIGKGYLGPVKRDGRAKRVAVSALEAFKQTHIKGGGVASRLGTHARLVPQIMQEAKVPCLIASEVAGMAFYSREAFEEWRKRAGSGNAP